MNQAWLRESAAALRSRLFVQKYDANGSRWTFTGCQPHPALARFVNAYWEVRGTFAHIYEKVLPTAEVVVIFNLGPTSSLCDRDNLSSGTPYRQAFVSSLQEEFLVITSPEGSWNCGVRLTPLGASRVLGVPMHELTNKVIDLAAVAGNRTSHLLEQLRNAGSPVERFALIDEFLFSHLGKATNSQSPLDWAWHQILSSDGGVRVNDLASEIGWSRKHLRAEFLEHIGMTPKTLSRLVRFHAALKRIAFEKKVEWAQVAQFCGYSDQAHFNRDFRAFSGETPEGYLRARIPDSEYGFMIVDDV
jgi:AraC-like DNA-binding protein